MNARLKNKVKQLRDEILAQGAKAYDARISQAHDNLITTLLIGNAMDDLMDTECPQCHRVTILPSLEDIQEWLKEEK